MIEVRPEARDAAPMDPVEAVALIVAGFVIGTYATAIGAGGGFLVAPLLLLLYPDAEPVAITTASLTVVLISASASTAVLARERLVDLPLVLAIATVTVPSAILGGLSTAVLPREAFAAGFAVLLVAIGAYLAWRPVARIVTPAKRAWRRDRTDANGQRYVYRIPVLSSILPNMAGAFTGALVGIGGGPLGVPILTRIMRVPYPIATTSMQALIVIQSGVVVAMHLALQHQGAPMAAVPWIALGGVVAAPLGRALRGRLGEGMLTRALALGLFFIAVRTAWSAF